MPFKNLKTIAVLDKLAKRLCVPLILLPVFIFYSYLYPAKLWRFRLENFWPQQIFSKKQVGGGYYGKYFPKLFAQNTIVRNTIYCIIAPYCQIFTAKNS